MLLPPVYQAGRYRLGADVHKPPCRQVSNSLNQHPSLDGVKYVLCPRNQEPDNCDFLLGQSLNPFGLHAARSRTALLPDPNSRTSAFRAGMVKRRYAEEVVLPCLAMMILLGVACRHKAPVRAVLPSETPLYPIKSKPHRHRLFPARASDEQFAEACHNFRQKTACFSRVKAFLTFGIS